MLTKLSLPQWSSILITLHRISAPYSYCQKLYREVNIASSHIRRILTLLETNGLITREKEGRIKHIRLTVKGMQIVEDVLRLKKALTQSLSAFDTPG